MAPMSKDRVESFSDGVFSIVLTLLVFQIHMPSIVTHSSLSQYAVVMKPLIPSFVSFLLTFVMICVHWVNHHYFFRHIRRATLGIVWINNLFLLWICLLPFPTAMLGDYATDQFPILLYAADSLFLAVTFYLFRSYAINLKLFNASKATLETLGPRHSIPAIIIYCFSIFFVFVNVYVSLACFFLVPLLYFIPNLIRSK